MRPLIVSEFVTLDGVMEAPGGEPTHPHTGWVFDYQGDEQVQYKLQESARRRDAASSAESPMRASSERGRTAPACSPTG